MNLTSRTIKTEMSAAAFREHFLGFMSATGFISQDEEVKEFKFENIKNLAAILNGKDGMLPIIIKTERS